MLILNYFLLPGVGLKHIVMNSFSNVYLQIWIEPVQAGSATLRSVKWSVSIVDLFLQIENLVILIVLLVGFRSVEVAQGVARSEKFLL